MTSVAQTRSRASSTEEDDRSENMKMPNVSIEGERQTPDIFFVFPTGKGGNLSAPRMRDYANDILEPVVKPWFEKDQAVNPALRVSSGEKQFNWDEALRSEPDRPPPAAPQANLVPPPQMPSQAQMLPQAQIPPQAQMAPPAQGQLGAAPSYPSQTSSYPSQTSSYPSQTSSYPSQAPSYPSQAPSYPSQASSYPSQAPSYPSQAPSYPSVPTANKPHYPDGYPAPSAASAPSYPNQAPRSPSGTAASAPPQIPSQALSLPQERPHPGIPQWATQPPPDPYRR